MLQSVADVRNNRFFYTVQSIKKQSQERCRAFPRRYFSRLFYYAFRFVVAITSPMRVLHVLLPHSVILLCLLSEVLLRSSANSRREYQYFKQRTRYSELLLPEPNFITTTMRRRATTLHAFIMAIISSTITLLIALMSSGPATMSASAVDVVVSNCSGTIPEGDLMADITVILESDEFICDSVSKRVTCSNQESVAAVLL